MTTTEKTILEFVFLSVIPIICAVEYFGKKCGIIDEKGHIHLKRKKNKMAYTKENFEEDLRNVELETIEVFPYTNDPIFPSSEVFKMNTPTNVIGNVQMEYLTQGFESPIFLKFETIEGDFAAIYKSTKDGKYYRIFISKK